MNTALTVSTSAVVGQRLRIKIQAAILIFTALSLGGLAAFGIIQSTPSSYPTPPTVQRSGILRVVAMDGASSGIPDQYYLETSDTHIQLDIPDTLAVPQNLASVVVTGTIDNEILSVHEIVEQSLQAPEIPSGRRTSKTVSAQSVQQVSGTYNTLVILGYYPGQSVPTSPTKADVESVFFGAKPSVADFYHDNSFGKATITGHVTEWIPLISAETSSIWFSISDATQAVKAADPSLDLTQFQHIILVSPYTATNLPDGYALIGPTSISSPDGILHVGTEMLRSTIVNLPRSVPILPYTAIHEFGHGLGLGHAGLLGCISVPVSLNCRIQEYADRFDVMGGAYELPGAENLNGAHLDSLGWLDADTMISPTITVGGDFVLTPMGDRTGGLKVLKIPRGQNDYIYVEYRRPLGYDTVLADATVFTGALLHITDAGRYINSSSVASDSLLVDPTPPADYSLNALHIGTTFTDPLTNMTLTVTSQTATELHIHMTPGSIPASLPAISMTSPLSNGTYAKQVAFSATASGDEGIQKVEFFLENALTPFATDTTEPYTATFDASGYADNATISAYVLATGNNGGRASTAPIHFKVTSTLPPEIPTISMPLPMWSKSYTSPVTFTANATSPAGIQKVDFYLKDAATPFATDTTYPYSATFDATGYQSGSVVYGYVLATGNDGGRASTAPIPFYVFVPSATDTVAPVISSLLPEELSYNNRVVTLYAETSDDHEVLSTRYYIDCPAQQSLAACSFYSVPPGLPLAVTLQEGTHTLRVRAEDYSGNRTESAVRTFYVDGSYPVVTVEPWTTTTFTTASSSKDALVYASDLVGIDRVVFYLDGKIVTTDTTAPYQTPIFFSNLTSGYHWWSANVYDRVGNLTTKSVSFTISSSSGTQTPTTILPPTITTSGIDTNSVVRGSSVFVQVSGPTTIGRVLSSEFYIDNQLVATKATAPFTYALDSVRLRNGAHQLKVVVHQLQAAPTVRLYNFVVSNPIRISLKSPAANATIRGKVTLAPTVSGGYSVSTIEYVLDGKHRLALKKSTPRSFVWDTKKVSRGKHTVRIIVKDVKGNIASTSVKLNVAR